MSFNARLAMARQVDAYRVFISDNGCVLHYRYNMLLRALNVVPAQTTKAYGVYAHASVFRELLQYEFYNSLVESLTVRWERGRNFCSVGTARIHVLVRPDCFDVTFDMCSELPVRTKSQLLAHRAALRRAAPNSYTTALGHVKSYIAQHKEA